MSIQSCMTRDNDPTGSSCRSLFQYNCIGNEENWKQGEFCPFMLRENRNSPEWTNPQMFSVFQSLGELRPLGEESEMQIGVYNACIETPNACRTALQSICSSHSIDSMKYIRGLDRFCGCYLPESEYIRESNIFNIKRECSATCTGSRVISFSNFLGEVKRCEDSLCLINDITIDLVDSTSGDITVSQLCGSCVGGSTCICKLENVTIQGVEADFGNINLEQNCQGEIECYGPDPENPSGPNIPVSCETLQQQQSSETGTNVSFIERFLNSTTMINYTSLGLVLVLILVIIFFMITRKTDKETKESDDNQENDYSDSGE